MEMHRLLEDQRYFAELFLPADVGRDVVLERVDGPVDWVALEAVCGEVSTAPVGRPSYPLWVLIKAMLSGLVELFGSKGGAASLERSTLSALSWHRADGEDFGSEHAVTLGRLSVACGLE